MRTTIMSGAVAAALSLLCVLQPVSAQSNRATLTQNGTNNLANIEQMASAQNAIATVTQTGNNNIAGTPGGAVGIMQMNSQNVTGTINQNGNANRAALTQDDVDNSTAAFTQTRSKGNRALRLEKDLAVAIVASDSRVQR